MAGLVDGLGFEEVNQAVTSTALISGTNVYAAVAVTGSELNSAAGKVTAVGLGSPVAYGAFIQAGSVDAGTGSAAWVVFGRVFSAAPFVIGTYSDLAHAAGLGVAGSKANTGSVYLMGDVASKIIDWIAIGKG